MNGYITNLTVQPGTMSTAYRPLVALINADSFRVDAFFRETQIRDFRPGDRALITLMTYSDTPLEATVESIGWGIARENGSTGEQLLPSVSPTFEWIRLAQRIPVRLHFDALPKGIELRAGTTAPCLSVFIPKTPPRPSLLCRRLGNRDRGVKKLEGEEERGPTFPLPPPNC
mgnify:FL=1